jgi:hypothetical protein
MTSKLILLFLLVFIPAVPLSAQCGRLALNPITSKLDCIGTGVSTSGTVLTNTIPKFTSVPNTITDSAITDNGAVSISETVEIPGGTLILGSNGTASGCVEMEGSSALGSVLIFCSNAAGSAISGSFPVTGAFNAGLGTSDSGYLLLQGALSGAMGITTPNNSAATNFLYVLPATAVSGGYFQDQGSTSCPILPGGSPAVCEAVGYGPANTTITVSSFTAGANTCYSLTGSSGSASTVSMTGLTTGMALSFTPTSSIAALQGWGSTGGLVLLPSITTSNQFTIAVCNQSGSSVSPGASVTFNVSAM